MSNITVRQTSAEDIPLLIALQKQIYPDIPPWSKGKLLEQIDIFPRGQLVAQSFGELLGSASSIIVAWDDWAEPHSWKEITSAGTFENHNPLGRTLYGVEVFVDPDSQGQGVGHMLNTAYYFTPNGNVFEQDKIHRTRWEREKWNTDAGDKLHLFETPFGKIAILICYDIEFPELARMVCEAGADILMVPSCTDDRQGFLRVRYCCHARAIENQVFVVMTSTVGNLPVEGLGMHYGQAAIITPSDFSFARDGIAAEGTPNIEQIIVADVDLQDLVSNRLSGTTIPLYDKRKNIYENPVVIIPVS